MRIGLKIALFISLCFINVACTDSHFVLLGERKLTLEIHTPYVEAGMDVKRGVSVTIDGDVNVDVLGTYTLTYTASFNFGIKTVTRSVTIVDTTAPVLTLKGSPLKILCPNKSYQEEGFTAIDNADGDLSAMVHITPIQNGLKYSVLDGSSNLAEMVRSFQIEDTKAPTLTLKGYPHLLLHLNGKYHEFGATASDNCDQVNNNIVITNNINPNVIGKYKVTYTVSDQSGNTTVLTRDVEVTNQTQTTVYLTFDDGPSYRTPEVLDILKAYHVKATFFVLKKSAEYEPFMLRAYREGNTVAMHGYVHTASTIYASPDAFFDNLYKVQAWVEQVTGNKSMIYRFPGGSSNMTSLFNPGIMTTLTQMILEKGFHYFDWNVSSGDGSSSTTTAQMISYVTKNIKVGSDNVVLMHDSESHDESVAAVAPILDYLISIDALVLPITMDTPQSHHHIAN